MGARSGRRSWPLAVVAAAVVLVVATMLGVAYRVLSPAEVVTAARKPYPAQADPGKPRVIGSLNAAPLIVDDRLRVYATTRQIRAEEPVDARTRGTPYWSFRRWPAELSAVVAGATTVVTRWSDGALVALNARTGHIAWRASGPRPDQGYAGRRTGASTVYTPVDLMTAQASDGRQVLLLTGGASRGYDLATGRQLWQEPDPGNCRTGAFTSDAGQLVTLDRCAQPPVLEFRGVATGTVERRWRPDLATELTLTPIGCRLARSSCPAVRVGPVGQGRSWLLPAPGSGGAAGPVAAPGLDAAAVTLVDGVAVVADGNDLVARSARTGVQVWRLTLPGPVRVVAHQPGRVHALTNDQFLLTLDPATGVQRSRVRLVYGRETRDWASGFVYAAGGFVALERLTPPVRPDADDQRYYATAQPVLFVAT